MIEAMPCSSQDSAGAHGVVRHFFCAGSTLPPRRWPREARKWSPLSSLTATGLRTGSFDTAKRSACGDHATRSGDKSPQRQAADTETIKAQRYVNHDNMFLLQKCAFIRHGQRDA